MLVLSKVLLKKMDKKALIEQYDRLCHLVVFAKEKHAKHLKELKEVVLKIRKL